MSINSKIEWTNHTWNPVTGCTKISQGCKNCYAEKMYERFNGPGTFKIVQCRPERLLLPVSWQKPGYCFVDSMSDLFHELVPFSFIDQVFAVMGLCPHITFQVCTKRSARMREYMQRITDEPSYIDDAAEIIVLENPHLFFEMEVYYVEGKRRKYITGTLRHDLSAAGWIHDITSGDFGHDVEFYYENDLPFPNVWLGVSVEDQPAAEQRVLDLMDTPAAIRFLSCEPLLGPVKLSLILMGGKAGIDWIIAGGESGTGARPVNEAWIRNLRDQCLVTRTPFFFKQWGTWLPESQVESAMPHVYKATALKNGYYRGSKKVNGRFLDGVAYNAMPISKGIHEHWNCVNCNKDCNADMKDYYMLKHDVWESIHPRIDGMLCMDCCEEKLGRKLQASDILDCALTRHVNPYTKVILEARDNSISAHTPGPGSK